MTLWKRSLHTLTFAIRPTLVSVSLALIFLTAIGVGMPAFLTARRSVLSLWYRLSEDTSRVAMQQAVQYLDDAPPFLSLANNFYPHPAQEDPFRLFDYAYAGLMTNAQFIGVSFATAEGKVYEVHRRADIGLRGLIWTPVSSEKEKVEIYRHSPEGEWIFENATVQRYNVRESGFWKKGLEAPRGKGIWSQPYDSALTKTLEFTYLQPHWEQGIVTGMWRVGHDLTALSDFLATLKVGKTGKVVLVASDGTFIASGGRENDPLLQRTWQEIQSHRPTEPFWFEFDNYMAYVEPFPKGGDIPWDKVEIPWNVVMVVPRREFLSQIVMRAILAGAIAVGCCIVFLFFALGFFGHVSKRLKSLALEMKEVGNLSFPPPRVGKTFSYIGEVRMMDRALDQMKIELQSFSHYVPVDLIRKILQSGKPAKLGGEITDLTVLFSDLANFTSVAESLSPDELVKILGDHFSSMRDVIFENKGIVDKFIGDSIMALWGAPSPLDAHALFACKSALAMQKAFSPRLASQKVSQRIGINSGPAIVGNIGSPDRMDYTALGDNVNLASRLEELNKYYGTQILVGENTAALVASEMLLRPLDRVAVKGKTHTTLIYELLAERKEADPRLIQAVEAFRSALEMLWQRQFDEAIQKFEEAHQLFGGRDHPSRYLAERCARYKKNPPPADWDGSFVWEQK